MYVVVGTIFLVLLLIRFGLRLAGFRLKPWLPKSGRNRYYADLVLSAVVLLLIALPLGFHPSYGMALVIVLMATIIAMGLESRRAGGKASK
jgi:hypothetical protein